MKVASAEPNRTIKAFDEGSDKTGLRKGGHPEDTKVDSGPRTLLVEGRNAAGSRWAVINPRPPRPSGIGCWIDWPHLTPRTPVGVLTGWTTACSGRPDPRHGCRNTGEHRQRRPWPRSKCPGAIVSHRQTCVPDEGYSSGTHRACDPHTVIRSGHRVTNRPGGGTVIGGASQAVWTLGRDATLRRAETLMRIANTEFTVCVVGR